jgi:predicted SAM-dependent methyltransferase
MDERIQRGIIALREWWASSNGHLLWEDAVRSVLNATDAKQSPRALDHDARALPDIEVVCDMGAELVGLVGERSASQIRACHVLEHAPYPETVNLLLKWKSLLIEGGLLYVEVPNLAWQIHAVASGEITVDEFVYFAYGEQSYPGNFHFNGFDSARLTRVLEESGFKDVSVQDIGQVLIAQAYKV